MTLFRYSAAVLAVGFAGTYFGESTYQKYKLLHGEKRLYPASDNNFCESLIQRRENIAQLMRNVFELKPLDPKVIESCFTEDVTYEDPKTLCQGKEEVFRCFSLQSIFIKEVETEVFCANQYKNFIAVNHAHKLHFKNKFLDRNLNGNLILELENKDGVERVKHIRDEWNHVAIVGSVSNPTILNSFIRLKRRARTLWQMFMLPYTNTGLPLYDTTVYFKNKKDERNQDKQLNDALLPPKPKHASEV